jgi:hypothetical protein
MNSHGTAVRASSDRWLMASTLAVTAVGGLLFVAVGVVAQGVTDRLDTTKLLTLTGQVMRLSGTPGDKHAVMVLAVPQGAGRNVWVVLGDAPASLRREGWVFGRGGPVAPGAEVTITAYRTKRTADFLPFVPASMPAAVDAAKAGRLVYAVDVLVSGGKKLPFTVSR